MVSPEFGSPEFGAEFRTFTSKVACPPLLPFIAPERAVGLVDRIVPGQNGSVGAVFSAVGQESAKK